MSVTERLPTELWTQIISVACVDGGRSACAISEVSHYFRSVVLPLQLDNVALLGGVKIVQFAQLLNRRASQPALRAIRHLFLSSAKIPAPPTRAELEAAVHHILTTVSSTLLALTNTLPQSGIGLDSVLCIPLPALRELTIHGPFDPILYADGVELQPSFPALRLLHILSFAEHAYLYTSRAPALTHVRFSTVVRLQPDLYHGILNALHEYAETDTEPYASTFGISRNVRRILVQADPDRLRFNRHLHENFFRSPLMKTLQEYAESGVGGRRFVWVEEPAEVRAVGAGRRGAGSEREWWAERVVDGPGCWVGHLCA